MVTMWCVVLVVIGVLFELRMVKLLYSFRIFENLLSVLLRSLIPKFLVKFPFKVVLSINFPLLISSSDDGHFNIGDIKINKSPWSSR